MITFKALRLSGFKSFVDKTELEIAPGLNGIVGPNGCGKSNLVEALRWVMGENSAKRMRGGGMEDVIFNGTDQRTQRNIAEVSLLLDNSKRNAPAAYNGSDELEVSRKIERDRGSNYRINGKTVRARDVQMLFADTVTGANSPALVSQGQVAKIINAKPLERRLILEESAGISGLYARRHEAELRLKAADANLQRIEDIFGGMESRLNSLKRQARAAGRYRNLNAQIRQLEIVINYLDWLGLSERIKDIRTSFDEAEKLVGEKMIAVTQLSKTQETLMVDLPALRKAEIDVSSSIQTKKIELQRLEDEEERRAQKLTETQEQLAQAKTDREHETQTASECAALIEKLDGEQKVIANEQDDGTDRLAEKEARRDALEQDAIKLEDQYTAMMQKTAETQARIDSLEQQIVQNKDRMAVVTARRDTAEEEIKALAERPSVKRDDKADDIAKLEKAAEQLAKDKVKNEADLEQTDEGLVTARADVRAATTMLAELNTEIQMLESFFQKQSNGDFATVQDDINVESGFEKALSRALGDSLLASTDDGAPFRWTSVTVKDLPALPKAIQPILKYVTAIKVLEPALSQIGFVGTQAEGEQLIDALLPGQSLVSKDGDYWRWDGYTVSAEAADRNATNLEYKNKLAALQKKKPSIQADIEKAEAALELLASQEIAFKMARGDIQNKLQDTQESIADLKVQQAKAMEEQAREESDKHRLQDAIKTAQEDLATLSEVITWDSERLENLRAVSGEANEDDVKALHANLLEVRKNYQDAMRDYDSYQQKQNTQRARLHAIADERVNTNNRLIRAREREKSLGARIEDLSERLATLKKAPKANEAQKEALLAAISEMDSLRDAAAEKLAEREAEIAQTAKALREAEQAMAAEREKRAAAQATLAGIEEQKTDLEAAIRETFEMAAHSLKDHITMSIDEENPNLDGLKSQKEQLVRERQNMGPVNLRADDEAKELEAEVSTMLHERNDLIAAIAELREGIAKINKEARERLLLAFDHVNAHFQRLFVQLFGGGKAHLALVDSEDDAKDPLGAGLEIFAQPPGKSLQSLSLLSGGEQTLASISLIFAMFLTNPSPICVLDEIDAPLDDANVERVCDLLDDITQQGVTRFLIITHHRLTMARMDRLYGVTMSEKGVSQLVSVDLQESFEFLEAA